MYVRQFWNYFEETGNVETYLDLKEYEKLYKEHIHSETTNNIEQIDPNSLDRMK